MAPVSTCKPGSQDSIHSPQGLCLFPGTHLHRLAQVSSSERDQDLNMFLASPWEPKGSERLLKALAECSDPDLPLHELQEIYLGVLPEIQGDRRTQHQIVVSRIKANDKAGVKWLLADPQRFPACYVYLWFQWYEVSNALHVAARQGHMELLIWLAQEDDAKYWSDIDQAWVPCLASPHVLDAAVEGGNLDVIEKVASWFSNTWKQDTDLTYIATAAVCQQYLEQKQQGEDVRTWQNGKHFEVLARLREEGVWWDKRSVGEAAKIGHLELIDWLSADVGPLKQHSCRSAAMQSTSACAMAIHNPDQDQAIKTLEHLLKRGFPWRPKTRGFAKQSGPNRQEEQDGLCQTAALLGRLKVLKWLVQDPQALLPLCKDSFEMRLDGKTQQPVSTGIPLTPWDDGNSPELIKNMATQGLAGRDFTEQAKQMHMPQHRMHEVNLPAIHRKAAEYEAKWGRADSAAHYQALAAQAEAEIQEYKDTLAWLDSAESGYPTHVQQQQQRYQELRRSLGIADKPGQQHQRKQQQRAASTIAGAAAATANPPGKSKQPVKGARSAAAAADPAVATEREAKIAKVVAGLAAAAAAAIAAEP